MNFANLCNFSSINLLIKRSLIIKWSHKNPVKIVTMLSFINRRLSIVIRFSKQVWNIPSYIKFRWSVQNYKWRDLEIQYVIQINYIKAEVSSLKTWYCILKIVTSLARNIVKSVKRVNCEKIRIFLVFFFICITIISFPWIVSFTNIHRPHKCSKRGFRAHNFKSTGQTWAKIILQIGE